jgi:hypothetical protein
MSLELRWGTGFVYTGGNSKRLMLGGHQSSLKELCPTKWRPNSKPEFQGDFNLQVAILSKLRGQFSGSRPVAMWK